MSARPSTYRPIQTAFPAAARSSIGTGRLSLAVVIYLLMIALPVQFNLGSVYMTGIRALLLITIVPLTIRLFSGKLGRVVLTDVLLLAYVLWAIVVLFINSPSQAVSIGGSYTLEVFGSYMLARNFVRTPEDFRAVCRGFFTVLIFSVPFAVYETQTGLPLIPKFINTLPFVYSWGDFHNLLAGRRLGLERSQVLFSHPIHYGLFCSAMASLAFVGFKGLIASFWRFLISALVCVGVICSVSSGALLPMVLQFFLALWAWVFNSVRSRWLILCGIIAFCYVVVDILSNRSPITVFLSYATLSPGTALGRVQIFEWGMNNVWKNPIFGIGLNDWERPAWKSASLDNFWLLVTVRYGIPGFFLLFTAYLSLVWTAMRRDFGDGGPIWQFRRGWVFMQVGMILTLATVDVWVTALSYVFFLLGSGAWFASAAKSAEPEVASAAAGNLPAQVSGVRYTRFPRPTEPAR